jgi:FkbH-like protein
MAQSRQRFENLLTLRSRDELRHRVRAANVALTLAEAQQLTLHTQAFGPAMHKLRVGIVHTYTSDLLSPWLDLAAALEGLDLACYHAPYGSILHEAQPDSALIAHKPDLTLLLLQPGDLHPDLAKPLSSFGPDAQRELRAAVLDRLYGILAAFRAQNIGLIVLTLLPPLGPPEAGLYDTQSESSERGWWAEFKRELGAHLRVSVPASLYLDLDEIVSEIGRQQFFDPRFWYSARYPFTTRAADRIAQRVIGLGAVLKYPRAKVIALDADNTLWGGILGEDGLAGIALGPEYPGNLYLDFQRRLLALQQRGFLLALCSKNNESDVDQLFAEHPHQLLKREHFAACQINWSSKVDNLAALAEELNLGLDSFIFVDDSDYECEAVRRRFPEIDVVQTPARAVDVPTCLDHLARLEVLSITAEDRAKTAMYAQERRRSASRQKLGQSPSDLRAYLESLDMTMGVSLNQSSQIKRLAQLTQKTNQFNLTTRRYDEQQIKKLVDAEDWLVAHFSLADIFGDSGVVGLALIHRKTQERAVLDTFLMSCRVIGREAEAAFLHFLMRHLSAEGAREMIAEYRPTNKNEMVGNFLPSHGFAEDPDGWYTRDLAMLPPSPESAFPIIVHVEAERALERSR